jgi:PAS domain S-box-containing protein
MEEPSVKGPPVQAGPDDPIHLRATIDRAPIGFCHFDHAGRFLLVNDRLCEILGFSREELLKLTFQQLTYAEDLEHCLALTAQLEAGEIPSYRQEKRFVRRDGAIAWTRVTVSSVPSGPEGGVAFFLGVAEDVSEERMQEERLRAALEASRTGTFRWDVPSGNVWWDENLVRLLGLSGTDRMATVADFIALVHEDDRERVTAAAARSAGEGCDFSEEFRVVKPNGEIHCLRGRGKAVRGEDNVPAYMTGAVTDITEQWRDRRALEERESLFHTLADAIPQLAWMADGEGGIDWFNQRWYEYTGCNRGDDIAEAWARVHPDHLERVSRGLGAAFASGAAWEDTFPIRGAGGEYRWFLTRALPVFGRDGRVGRWFGTNTDVTAEHEADLERQRLLAREQQARLAAERATRARDEMVAVVAHDLRNPLHVLGMSVGVLAQSGPGDARAASLLKTMPRILGGMQRLLNDLLDTSRMDAGTFGVTRVLLDPASLLDAVCDVHEAAAREVGLRLVCRVAPGVPAVLGDADRLLQVFSNLIGNAIKFSQPPGDLVVEIAASGDDVRFSISDCGPGIEASAAARIFDRFWMLDRSERRGAGLGLAIAKGIVEAHGGRIWVESGGSGSTFHFTIPSAP